MLAEAHPRQSGLQAYWWWLAVANLLERLLLVARGRNLQRQGVMLQPMEGLVAPLETGDATGLYAW
jgi:hypothetical protein